MKVLSSTQRYLYYEDTTYTFTIHHPPPPPPIANPPKLATQTTRKLKVGPSLTLLWTLRVWVGLATGTLECVSVQT